MLLDLPQENSDSSGSSENNDSPSDNGEPDFDIPPDAPVEHLWYDLNQPDPPMQNNNLDGCLCSRHRGNNAPAPAQYQVQGPAQGNAQLQVPGNVQVNYGVMNIPAAYEVRFSTVLLPLIPAYIAPPMPIWQLAPAQPIQRPMQIAVRFPPWPEALLRNSLYIEVCLDPARCPFALYENNDIPRCYHNGPPNPPAGYMNRPWGQAGAQYPQNPPRAFPSRGSFRNNRSASGRAGPPRNSANQPQGNRRFNSPFNIQGNQQALRYNNPGRSIRGRPPGRLYRNGRDCQIFPDPDYETQP